MDSLLRCFGEVYDVNIVRARGCNLYTDNGRKIIDLEAGVWSTCLGHNHPAVNTEEVIRVLREEDLVARNAESGEKFRSLLNQLNEHKCVEEVRGRGLMLAVEFHEGLDLPALHCQLLDSGFLAGCVPTANTLRFYPALNIEEQDFAAMVQCLDRLLGNN